MSGRFRGKIPLYIGIAIVVTVVLIGTFLIRGNSRSGGPDGSAPAAGGLTTIKCIGGSEKSELLADPHVKDILAGYGLTVEFTPMGSYDQVQLPTADLQARGINCLWPSSASAQLVFESVHPDAPAAFNGYRAETLLQSPTVIYAGPQGTDALVRAGIVQQRDGKSYIIDMKRLLQDYILDGKTWESLGAADLRGPVVIGSTDPAKSNSGFTLAQLELSIVSTPNVSQSPNAEQARAGLPQVRQLYDAQGLQARSSDSGFDQWLLQGGELRSPLYAGYENQIIQKMVALKAAEPAGTDPAKSVVNRLSGNVRVLYPDPTIYNDHPILALDPGASRFIDAMKDRRIQTIAWESYGFRSGTEIGLNDTALFPDLPLADQVRTIAPTNAAVTLMLLDCIKNNRCS